MNVKKCVEETMMNGMCLKKRCVKCETVKGGVCVCVQLAKNRCDADHDVMKHCVCLCDVCEKKMKDAEMLKR